MIGNNLGFNVTAVIWPYLSVPVEKSYRFDRRTFGTGEHHDPLFMFLDIWFYGKTVVESFEGRIIHSPGISLTIDHPRSESGCTTFPDFAWDVRMIF